MADGAHTGCGGCGARTARGEPHRPGCPRLSRYCPAYGPGSAVCPRDICDCFIDQFPDDMEQAGALHPEFYTVVGRTPVWERCAGPCGREFAHPHLCRKHMLCGICHQEVLHG